MDWRALNPPCLAKPQARKQWQGSTGGPWREPNESDQQQALSFRCQGLKLGSRQPGSLWGRYQEAVEVYLHMVPRRVTLASSLLWKMHNRELNGRLHNGLCPLKCGKQMLQFNMHAFQRTRADLVQPAGNPRLASNATIMGSALLALHGPESFFFPTSQ